MKNSVSTTCWPLVAGLVLALSLATIPAAAQANLQGQWTTLPTLMPINPVHVALLHTGKVLVVSGSGNVAGNTNYQAGIWDPITDTVTTQSISWDMFCNGMVVLSDGRPFINGGTLQYDPFHGELKSAVYDPSTGNFTNLESMAHGRWYPTVTMLGDGRVMTFSGLDEFGSTSKTVEIYTVGSGWSSQYTAPWTPPLYPRMHLLPSGQVFYSGSSPTSALFDPTTHLWTQNVATTKYGQDRSYGSSVLLPLLPENNYDPKVMILGGGGTATNTTEVIDLGSPSPAWQWGPPMSQARIEMNAVILPTGKVLAMGGSGKDENASTASFNADLYDSDANAFDPNGAGVNAFARLYHSVALLLPDATVWLAGGNPTRGSYEQQMEIYQPAYLFTTDGSGHVIPATRPTITNAPAIVTWGTNFTVQTPDADSIAKAVLVRPGAVTHAFDMDQRLVGMSFSLGSGALTLAAPPNGNIAPPGYYMLFLLNNAGVPSVASFVQVGVPTDFAISPDPSSQTVVQGDSTSYTINLTSSNGFSGTAGLTVDGLPSGATAGFSPDSIIGVGSSTMTVDTLATTPTGSYPLTITATSGSLSHNTTATLVVDVAPDFTLAAIPPRLLLHRGSNVTFKVTVGSIGGFSGDVTLSSSGLPPGTRATFSRNVITGSGSSLFRVAASPNAVPGIYTLTISGSSGNLSHSTTVDVKIQ